MFIQKKEEMCIPSPASWDSKTDMFQSSRKRGLRCFGNCFGNECDATATAPSPEK